MQRIRTALDQSLARQYQMTQSEMGLWIHIEKETAS
jgi:hypothetical protein